MNPKAAKAVQLGSSLNGIAEARQEARQHLPGFPHSGCAAFLSSLLRQAGLSDLSVTLGAQDLADTLEKRGWRKVPVGFVREGDVGVTLDGNHNGLADHIYLVLERVDSDLLRIADNQQNRPHSRSARGHDGRTPTEYFLRAPDA